MQWTDEALILGTKRHGETSVILEVMTHERGRHLGLVRGGRSKRLQPTLQAGNRIAVTWRARLEEHLGIFSVEPLVIRAADIMTSGFSLRLVQVLAGHLRLLPERDPHPGLSKAAEIIIEKLDEPLIAAALLVRFELALLDELGFGLDLHSCAATGSREALIYVSPKSGRAVSEEAGKPYHDKVLALPAFLISQTADFSKEALVDGFHLTGFFLTRHIYDPRRMTVPPEREGMMRQVIEGSFG